MIDLVANQLSNKAARLVLAALKRSVSSTQARWISSAAIDSTKSKILVAIDPMEDIGNRLLPWLKDGRKLILLGKLPKILSEFLGLQTITWTPDPDVWSRSASAPTHGFAESRAWVRYGENAGQLGAAGWGRPFERFDFTDEWNNLGYGAIRADSSIWSISMPLQAQKEHEVARIEIDEQESGTYCALFHHAHSSVLWFNRSIGPIDSFEWRAVERFISSVRMEELPCQPIIQEIPWGYDAAVTMRLDCDEDVESARALWKAYRDMRVPFSLAVHTSNLGDSRHHSILQEMEVAGESILSHTATHAPNWGGSYDAALNEGLESARSLKDVIGRSVRYAVSPFHQSPPYALAALADAGYQGCIGGIIRNDPEFLMARGGYIDGLPEGFVGHSQQYMLHGDCMLSNGDPLTIYKTAFDRAKETRTLFGYLDHPFAERYQYGWADESSRIAIHQEFVRYIRDKAEAPLFMSEEDAMDFLSAKAQWQIIDGENCFHLVAPSTMSISSRLLPTVEYRGCEVPAQPGVLSV